MNELSQDQRMEILKVAVRAAGTAWAVPDTFKTLCDLVEGTGNQTVQVPKEILGCKTETKEEFDIVIRAKCSFCGKIEELKENISKEDQDDFWNRSLGCIVGRLNFGTVSPDDGTGRLAGFVKERIHFGKLFCPDCAKRYKAMTDGLIGQCREEIKSFR